jgi:hypothetical protein
VANALSVQALKSALNEAQVSQPAGLARSGAAAGPVQGYKEWQSRNYAQGVRVAGGRSFFRNGAVWIDSAAQLGRGLKRRQVRFAGEAYFELLRRESALSGLLWLGSEIDVVVDDTLYEIRGN